MAWSVEDENAVDEAVLAVIYALPASAAANIAEMYRQTARRLNALAEQLGSIPDHIEVKFSRRPGGA
jgi:hypothetical protein